MAQQKRAVYFDYRLDNKRILMLNNMSGKLKKLHDEFQMLADETANLFKMVANDIRRNITISRKSYGERGQEYTNVVLRNAKFDIDIQKKLANQLGFVEEALISSLNAVKEIRKESSVEVNIDKKIESEIMGLSQGKFEVDRMPFYQR